jgi:hypothetical protein
MDKLQKYKNLYPTKDGLDNLVLHESGKVSIPKWLIHLLLNESGIKSRKKRILKKVLKRQLQKLLERYVEENTNT